jgi:eukaryotic-like serine/threonine-protein kinase
MSLSSVHPSSPQPSQNYIQLELFSQSCGFETLLEEQYQVLALLGQGECSKTYEIRDLNGAVKVLKVLSKTEPKYVELFQREAQVLSQLNHPGIPSVDSNAYFTHFPQHAVEPLHCLVMEKITGLDLQKYIAQRGKPIDQVLGVHWLIQLTGILQAVHGQNFLHRDIKPSNIMLKSDGHLALIDFGTARTVTDAYDDGREAIQTTRIMSSLYTSHEQMKGKPLPQSDFFALGRTFIYLLTARDLRELYEPETDRLHWRCAVPHLNPDLICLLDQLMSPIVAQRPANADVLLQRLMAVQQELLEPISKSKPVQTNSVKVEEAALTRIAPHLSSHKVDLPVPSQSPLSQEFLMQCEQELAECIGPIAEIVCQQTLDRNPSLPKLEFIKALAEQIPNLQDAQAFQQRSIALLG